MVSGGSPPNHSNKAMHMPSVQYSAVRLVAYPEIRRRPALADCGWESATNSAGHNQIYSIRNPSEGAQQQKAELSRRE